MTQTTTTQQKVQNGSSPPHNTTTKPPSMDQFPFRSFVESRLKSSNIILSPSEQAWMNNSCLQRFLSARNKNQEKAYQMLKSCLEWRRHFRIEQLLLNYNQGLSHPNPTYETIKNEGETGKIIVLHQMTKNNQAVLLLRPGFENSSDSQNQITFLVWSLEKASLHSKWIVLVDYQKYSFRNAVSINTAKETVHILQNCYPERLEKAFLIEPPSLFWMAWKVVKFFVDKVTKDKLCFVERKDVGKGEEWEKYFDMTVLPKGYGGLGEWEWDNNKYFEEAVWPEYLLKKTAENGTA